MTKKTIKNIRLISYALLVLFVTLDFLLMFDVISIPSLASILIDIAALACIVVIFIINKRVLTQNKQSH